MTDRLHIAAAQPASVAHDVAANVQRHVEAVEQARARVVVFPELSLTGYHLDAEVVEPRDRRLLPLVEACTRLKTVALVGAPVPGPHIGFLAVGRAGATVAYRKLYLGDEEAERFVPGPAPVVFEVDGWRLGLAICKDTGVAEHAAATAALGIDAYVAGTVKHDHEADLQAARAARIASEHAVHVVVASCAGPTGGGFERTAGASGVWAPGGAVIAQADAASGAVVSHTFVR